MLGSNAAGAARRAARRRIALGIRARVLSATAHESLPGPPQDSPFGAFPYIMQNGGPTAMHNVYQCLYKEFGDVARFDLQGNKRIVLANPADMMTVMRADAKYPPSILDFVWPFRAVWECEELKDWPPMFSILSGEEWRKGRHVAQKNLFSPAEAEAYIPVFVPVCRDAAEGLTRTKSAEEFERYLSRTTFELICSALFNERMGVLSDDNKSVHMDFVNTSIDLMNLVGQILFSPLSETEHRATNSKEWQQFKEYFIKTMLYAFEHVKKSRAELEAGTSPKIDPGVKSYLEAHIELGECSDKDLAVNVASLMFAGIDTTSRTLLWSVLHIAENPDVQERLHEEIKTVLGDEPFSRAKMKDLVYLKAVIREAHRITPASSGVSRVVKNDLEISNGVTLASGTQAFFVGVGKSMDPALFESPEKFMPERWLDPAVRDDKEVRNHRLLATPFSFGSRMCLGARLAEMEQRVFLTELVRNYRLSSDTPGQWVVGTTTLTVPMPMQHIKVERR